MYQLSTIWGKEIGKDTHRLNAAKVIGKFIKEDYGRQDAKEVEMPLTADERSYFITGIAVGMMMENDYSNQISKFLLRNVVLDLLDEFPKISPYRDTVKGKKQGHLFKRLSDNEHDFETVLKDVIAGGILVADLSGSGIFRFAHKSYLEYLISDFYVNQLLQDGERTYDLKIANAIKKALYFKDNQLEQSSDINNFVAQLIANRIQLKDRIGGKIPKVKGSEKAYSEYIFNKLCPTLFERIFPKWMFWLRLHRGLLPLHAIELAIMILGFMAYYFGDKNLAGAVVAGQVLWYFAFYYFGLLKSNEQIEIKPSLYMERLKLWQHTIQNMELTNKSPKLSKNIKTILSLKLLNYKATVLNYISLQLAITSILAGSVTVAFVFTGTVEVTLVGVFVGGVALIFVGIIAFLYRHILIVAVAVTVAFAFVNAFAIAGTNASLGTLLFIHALYVYYQNALEAKQKRKEEADIFVE